MGEEEKNVVSRTNAGNTNAMETARETQPLAHLDPAHMTKLRHKAKRREGGGENSTACEETRGGKGGGTGVRETRGKRSKGTGATLLKAGHLEDDAKIFGGGRRRQKKKTRECNQTLEVTDKQNP